MCKHNSNLGVSRCLCVCVCLAALGCRESDLLDAGFWDAENKQRKTSVRRGTFWRLVRMGDTTGEEDCEQQQDEEEAMVGMREPRSTVSSHQMSSMLQDT